VSTRGGGDFGAPGRKSNQHSLRNSILSLVSLHRPPVGDSSGQCRGSRWRRCRQRRRRAELCRFTWPLLLHVARKPPFRFRPKSVIDDS